MISIKLKVVFEEKGEEEAIAIFKGTLKEKFS